MFSHLQSDAQLTPVAADSAAAPDCGQDPIAALKTMFVDMVQGRRIAQGQNPALRPVFLKPHGVARGTFTVRPDLPEDLRVGVFKHSSFPAWIRFSSDTLPTRPDLKSTLGIGIKLFNVPGTKLLEPEVDAPTHDFLLQNHDVFFVDTALDMCEFTYAGVVQGNYAPYLQAHPKTQQILNDMAKVVPSVLATPYWSGLPYAFGSERYVKYKLEPVQIPELGSGTTISQGDPYYLHADLRQRLLNGDAQFHFYVQFSTNLQQMPIDAATVRWEESLSPPVLVATLSIPRQDIDARGQADYGENLAYNTWHALPEHEPVGSIAHARKVVYQAAAEVRRNVNGIAVAEPLEPRPLMSTPAGRDQKIVRAAIHPAIGVARVGDSQDEYFVGPEVTDPEPASPGFYKDAAGALKRQAARFHLYGYNAAGEVVAELTPNNADITWTVHVANKKAAWYEFQIALDIPEAPSAPDSLRRNAKVPLSSRNSLIIDPGARSIRGQNTSGEEYKFNSGTFFGKEVYLGELRTDAQGCLLFLGGCGVSASHDGSAATTFANNDGWHDDVSDGPVTATVNINGQPIPVDPAWVVVGPPNYAPEVTSIRTMYDLLYDAYVQAGWIPFPEQISFTEHIYPTLQRFCNLQWVNHGFAAQYGWGAPNYFLEPAYMARLASNAESDKELRQQILTAFRDYSRDGFSPVPWPWLYGDAMNLPPDSPRQHLDLAPTQTRMFEMWVDGNFTSDFDPSSPPVRSLAQLPLQAQPDMLDRAALHFCLADAFHPGCEMTWPMRHTSLYAAPFRIRHRSSGQPEPDYGKKLTPTEALSVDGPLYAQGPGDITRWMAVPWQTDTASCRAGYEVLSGFGPRYDPYLPTFWPAHVPNHVLTKESYDTVMDSTRSREERLAAFRRRAVWYRVLRGDYKGQINMMVRDFGKLGVVEVREGIQGDPDFPPSMLVESQPGLPVQGISPLANLVMLHLPQARGADGAEVEGLAAAATELPEEQVVAGFIDKVKRRSRHPVVELRVASASEE